MLTRHQQEIQLRAASARRDAIRLLRGRGPEASAREHAAVRMERQIEREHDRALVAVERDRPA